MTEPSSTQLLRLDSLGVIAVTGPDAKSFLQGQLSFDLERLSRERMELASCSSSQGRVQAVLWLIERSAQVCLIAPSSMLEATLARLRKYVLRAKVRVDASPDLAVFAAQGASVEGAEQRHLELDGQSYIRWPGGRIACVAPAALGRSDAAAESVWRLADIAAGLPQVYPQTHEAFVAQMLNLDVLGGISFEKGCYTGQEIIARTHFRGAIKRRMLRFATDMSPPAPGTRIVSDGQHAGDVVDAAPSPTGCELLAVVSLTQAQGALHVAHSEGPKLRPLPLPYPIAATQG